MTIKTFLLSRLNMPRRGRVVFVHDVIMAACSFVLSMYLRVGDSLFAHFSPPTLFTATLVFTAIAAATFLLTRLYSGVWRYASVTDMVAVAQAATITILVFVLVLFLWTRLEPLPRSVPFINWLMLTALLAGPRFLYRIVKDRRMDRRLDAEAGRKIPVLLAGSGHEAELFIRGLRNEPQRIYTVVGIVSEQRKRVGQQIHGVPVLGTVDNVPAVVDTLKAQGRAPERIIVTKDHIGGATVRGLFDTAASLGMTLARMPRLTDFRGDSAGRTVGSDVRPIAIEDLLGRPQTPLDRESMREMIAGHRVAVTGAGGSIGSELVRQIADFNPGELLLIEQSEFNLYTIEAEARRRNTVLRCPAVIADVRDRERIERLSHVRP